MGEEITEPLEPAEPDWAALKAQIIERFGTPENANHRPVNISAIKLRELGLLKARCMTRKHRAKVLLKMADSIERLFDESKGESSYAVDSDIPDEMIIGFSVREQRVIREYFSYSRPSINMVAQRLSEEKQYIRSFVASKAFVKLENQVCVMLKDRMPYEAWMAVKRVLKNKDSSPMQVNAATAILEDAGQLKTKASTEINLFQAPKIADEKAEEELRKLGDKLANVKEDVAEVKAEIREITPAIPADVQIVNVDALGNPIQNLH